MRVSDRIVGGNWMQKVRKVANCSRSRESVALFVRNDTSNFHEIGYGEFVSDHDRGWKQSLQNGQIGAGRSRREKMTAAAKYAAKPVPIKMPSCHKERVQAFSASIIIACGSNAPRN